MRSRVTKKSKWTRRCRHCNFAISPTRFHQVWNTLQQCSFLWDFFPGKGKKLVIDDVSGRLESGRLGAILGPSGAGKTSLLNILSGFKHKDVHGSIFIDGRLRNVKGFRKMSTYISQTFPMLENLTVYETLQVSADLKLGTNVSSQAKSENVSCNLCTQFEFGFKSKSFCYFCFHFLFLF